MMRGRTKTSANVAAALVLAMALASSTLACGKKSTRSTTTRPVQGDKSGVVVITMADGGFGVPKTLAPGWTTIKMTNEGRHVHQAFFYKLAQGVNFLMFEGALGEAARQKDTLAMMKAFELGTPMGGVDGIAPGFSEEVTIDLTPGQYILVDFMPAPDGQSNITHGLITPIRVSGEATRNEPPSPTGTITLSDTGFGLPQGFDGQGTFLVENTGQQPHAMLFVRVKSGFTPDQVEQFMSDKERSDWFGPMSPFLPVGGLAAIAPGGKAYLDLDLGNGFYGIADWYPNTKTGKLHLQEGLWQELQIGDGGLGGDS